MASQNVKRGWLGNYFIKMIDPDLKATKYKAMTKHAPAAGRDAFEGEAEFLDHRERLTQQLSLAIHTDLNKTRSTIHEERHIRQADRILI